MICFQRPCEHSLEEGWYEVLGGPLYKYGLLVCNRYEEVIPNREYVGDALKSRGHIVHPKRDREQHIADEWTGPPIDLTVLP